ncbi:hypothetical protein AB0I81_45100 [Nonomuraea sp. NPDC050404]|uniref:hypothetical protein n=1 Tax=Nonomuraea sp. NPDC050404 TaxID=3155783 RepID=UPI0033FBE46B
MSATPYEPLDVEWLWEITRLTITAEAAGLPTAVMALGLVAVLAFRGAWSARVTAALFVAIAVVFTIPYAITTVPDDCGSSLRFGGWHIVEPGPAVHYLAAAALVGSLGRIRSRRGTGAERMIG